MVKLFMLFKHFKAILQINLLSGLKLWNESKWNDTTNDSINKGSYTDDDDDVNKPVIL